MEQSLKLWATGWSRPTVWDRYVPIGSERNHGNCGSCLKEKYPWSKSSS